MYFQIKTTIVILTTFIKDALLEQMFAYPQANTNNAINKMRPNFKDSQTLRLEEPEHSFGQSRQ